MFLCICVYVFLGSINRINQSRLERGHAPVVGIPETSSSVSPGKTVAYRLIPIRHTSDAPLPSLPLVLKSVVYVYMDLDLVLGSVR